MKAKSLTDLVQKPKSLKDLVQEFDRQYEETGHRFGLKELRLKKESPTKYEAVWATLERICEDAAVTAANVSASAAIGEARDACWGILAPTGEVICCSSGVIAHFPLPTQLIRWMTEQGYEDDPGIHPGDIFECNSPHAGVHANDIYDIVPIYWENELVGWTFGSAHTLDVGALSPGSLNMASKEIFTDGLIITGEKIGVNDELKKEYEIRVNQLTRMGFFWLLDTRARVAGCHMARKGLEELIKRYGVDYYKEVVKEFVEDSRRYATARIKTQAVPGRMRRRSCKDIAAEGKRTLAAEQARNFLLLSALEINVDEEAKVKVNFEGTSKWVPLGVNVGLPGVHAFLACVFCNVVGFEYHNTGSYGDLTIQDPPPGSFMNPYPVNPFAPYGSSWAVIWHWMSMGCEAFSRYYFSRGFVEEVLAGTSHMPGIEIGGSNLSGIYTTVVNVELVPGGMGARAVADGEDTAWGCNYPAADMGNAEGLETVTSFVWLARRFAVDGSGKGKYRGGLHLDSLYMIWPSKQGEWTLTDCGITNRVPHNSTMYGAYPAPVLKTMVGDGNAVKKRIDERKDVILTREDPRKPGLAKLGEGNYQAVESPILVPETLSQYSVIEGDHGGAPGFGDPLERDPALVKSDLDTDRTTVETARDIWGVVATYDKRAREWVIDDAATKKRRAEIVAARKKIGVPFKEWWTKSRERVKRKDLIEPVRRMFSESMSLSPAYAREVREFWGLPENFEY